MGVELPSAPAIRDEHAPAESGEPAPLPHGAPDRAAAQAWLGRVAGGIFIGGALLAVPGTLLLDPVPPLSHYALTLVAIATGVACLLWPAKLATRRRMHALAAIGTVQIAVGVALFDLAFSTLYFTVAVLAAYGFGRARDTIPHLVAITALLFAPALYDPAQANHALVHALLVAPPLWLVAGAVLLLRSQLATRERQFHIFAEQAFRLTDRIAGRPMPRPAGYEPARSLAHREPARLPRRTPRRALAALGVAAGAVLAPVGLAAAGVALPDVVRDPYERLGLDLGDDEIQTPAAPAPNAADADRLRAPVASERQGRRDASSRRAGAEDRRKSSARRGGAAQGGGSPAGGGAAPAPVAVPGGSTGGADGGESGSPPQAPSAPSAPQVTDPVRQPLGEIVDDLRQLLPLAGQSEPEE